MFAWSAITFTADASNLSEIRQRTLSWAVSFLGIPGTALPSLRLAAALDFSVRKLYAGHSITIRKKKRTGMLMFGHALASSTVYRQF